MTDRHQGRREIATCNNDTGIRLSQIFENLENVAVRVANLSAESIRAFLMEQPADLILPPTEADKAKFWAKDMDRQTSLLGSASLLSWTRSLLYSREYSS